MNYEFPEITGLSQIEKAIEGRKEFVVAQRDWGYAVDYKVALTDTFASTDLNGLLRRECRGLKFDTGGNLIARPFHKFFNLGEREETQPYNVDFSQSHVILSKLDGSMIHTMLIGSDVVYCTKMGPTVVAEPVQVYADNHKTIRYNDFCSAMMDYGFTPIFEWCSPQQRIVIDYTEDNLILTGIRNTRFGHYMNYEDIQFYAEKFNIPVVDVFGDTIDDIDKFADRVSVMEEGEGCIIFFGGHMLKLKNLKYLRIHHAKDSIRFEKNAWKHIVDGKLDDVIAFLDDEDRDWLMKFQDAFWERVTEVADKLQMKYDKFFDEYPYASNKDFAIDFVNKWSNHFSNMDRVILFNIHKGDDAEDAVVNIIKKNIGNETALNDMKPLMKNLNWK